MTSPIELAARQHPTQLAFDDGEVQIAYADLVAKLSESSRRFADADSGAHVAWCPKNDADAFLTFWALQQHGCVACPVSHRFPEALREEIVQRLDAVWLPDLSDAELNQTESDRATIILSSGSTGVPKAIVHTMAAHVASAKGAATNMQLDPGDRWLWSLPLCHVSGLSILVRCAVASATVVGMPTGSKLSARLLDEQRITHLSVVTTQLRRLLADENFPSLHLKAVLLGGSSVDSRLVAAARERGVSVHTTYGLSEMASQVTTSTSTDDPSKCGRVLPGRQLEISASGEILVRGETLCLGYYGNGKVESAVDESGWFHTGDLGELDEDQQLTVKGRIDNMFISGGENIHPENIERAMRSAFEIDHVIVVPRSDETFGNRPVAFVQGDLPADWEAILREKLQGYQIPVDVLAWPAEAEGAIKPNRKHLQKLAPGGLGRRWRP